MRTFFTYLAMVLAVLLLFKFNIFAIFAHKSAFVVGIILVIGIFAVAVRILGNPLARKDDKDEDNN